jgi:phosphoribosyl 1,2-cyclic phosphodiesterase/CRP-like cAMP-binding protein/CheY-like chemotaxis protein
MRVHFWGTRGSVPTPGPATIRFGGNTSCVEVVAADGTCVVLDCGTGARELGLALLAAGPPPIHILLTHTHWDHIQGFPFFAPAYLPGAIINMYATHGLESTLEEALSGQMQHTYFPVRLSELRAQIAVHEVGEGTFRVGGITIHTQYLNHTAPCLGYRLEAGGVSLVYATDHEPFWWEGPKTAPAERLLHPGDRRHIEWLAGADLVIHDGQFTDAEYPAKRSWGHSSVEYATDLAILAGVKRLVLFHHDPTRMDQMVARIAQRMLRRARKQGSNLDVIAAAEGLDIELPEAATTQPGAVAGTRPVITHGRSVMLAGGDEVELVAVRQALEPDGYRFVTTGSVDRLGHQLAQECPDLLILAQRQDEGSPVALAQRLRAGSPVDDLPIIIMAREVGPNAAGLLSLGTDIVLRPWSAPMLRARLRAWLGRAALLQPAQPVRPTRRLLSTGQQLPTLFRGLPARARALFLDSARPVSLLPGEVLVHENQPASGVYLIRTGTVSISISGSDGQQIHLGTAGPGETIGELAVLGGGHHSATVVALGPIMADHLPPDAFLAIVAASPEAMLRLLRLLTARLRASDARIVELASTGLYNRVVQLLLEGSGHAAGPTALDTASLVHHVQAGSEQLRRVVMLLEAHGLIRTGPKGVEVLDPQGLRRLIGLDEAGSGES